MKTTLALLFLTAFAAAADDARLEFAYGVLEEARSNRSAAEKHFDLARLADPAALPLVRRAAAARLTEGDRAGAVTLYRGLAEARPDELDIQLVYADFLQQQGRGDALALQLAGQTLDKALETHPGNPEIIRRLAEQALATGDRRRQLELMERLPTDDAQAAILYASMARRLTPPQDDALRDRVDARFRKALENAPTDAALARTASDHFHESGRLAEAITILEQHVKAAPSSLPLRIRLGVLCFAAKRDTQGERVLLEVLEISPDQALAHQALAKFHRLRGMPEPARFHASELLRIRGGSAAEFTRLADEWLAADQPRQARLLLEKAVFVHPENLKLLEKLAIATRRDPDTLDQAARLFREAEAARKPDAPVDPAFQLESAEALIASGQNRAAEERLRTAIRAFPADARRETAAALRRLALLWESENRNAEAARALRQRADALSDGLER